MTKKSDTTTYRFDTVGQMVDEMKPSPKVRGLLYIIGYLQMPTPLSILQNDVDSGRILKSEMMDLRSFAQIKRLLGRSKVPPTKTLDLSDDKIAILAIHKLFEENTPRVAGHDEARRKATEVMDWLRTAKLLSREEAVGWKALKASAHH